MAKKNSPPSKPPAVGDEVKDITLESSSGKTFTLSDYRGKIVILFFYPKDMTPGCTTEGIEFNELLSKFKKKGALIFGVSRDSLASHDKFICKHGFEFELLSDKDEELCRYFDVIKEKNMYGKKVMGIERSTFVIDKKGILTHELRKVKAEGHAQAVLDLL